MVHLRLNEKENGPNPHVNFITSLTFDATYGPSSDDATHLLKALAAQVKPIMKNHGFVVNSFEEYECNRVFLGRNWNHGETVELVLRRADGSFYGTNMLLDTLCHELAHIKHMNHSSAFQKLWATLRSEVEMLQMKGYFGDGFWSSGQRLEDSRYVQGKGISGAAEVMPEYICGGSHSEQRAGYMKARRGVRRPRKEIVPSLHSGAQTGKKKKAGSRLNKDLPGEGSRLSDTGGSKGKHANSKRAREERAMAAERRLQLASVPDASREEFTVELDSEDDLEDEDDALRLQVLRDAVCDEDLTLLRIPPGLCATPAKEDPNLTTSTSTSHLRKRRANDHLHEHRKRPKSETLEAAPLSQFWLSAPKAPRVSSEGPTQHQSGSQRSSSSPKDGHSTLPDYSSWVCSTCTLINEEVEVVCGACGAKR